MNHAYEDLAGGAGRSVYFRAQRFRARASMKEIAPSVTVGDTGALLFDYSMTGLAVRVHEMPVDLRLGAIVPLSLMLNERPVFSGQAQVVRAESGPRWTTLGMKLIDNFLDPVVLQAAHDRIVMENAVTEGTNRFASVGADYRQLCGDAAFFLEYWRSTLDRLEATEPSGFSRELVAEIEGTAEEQMRREWNAIRAKGNELTRALSPSDPTFMAVKQFTEIQLTQLTLVAPIWKRAFEKPLGYPGDFVLMTYMYDQVRRGDTAFSRILHQLGREERLAATVPSRRDLLVGLIREVVQGKSPRSDRPVALLNIGAGPAREIEDYIAQDRSGVPLVVSLIDQDEDALTYACERIRRSAARYGRRIEIRARYVAFGQLLSRRDLLAELRGQDLIYSAGLVDYLSDRVAQELIHLCYELAAPGSLLAFGNALAAPDVRWVPEFLLDWHMIYRNKDELQELAALIPLDARMSIRTDLSSAWCFLLVGKPPFTRQI